MATKEKNKEADSSKESTENIKTEEKFFVPGGPADDKVQEDVGDVSIKSLQGELEEAISFNLELESKNIALEKQIEEFKKIEPERSSLTVDHVVRPLEIGEKIDECVFKIEQGFGLLGSSLKIKNQAGQHITSKTQPHLDKIKELAAQLKAAQVNVAKHSGL